MRSEYSASMALEASKKEVIQAALKERNKQTILDEQLRKQRVNSARFHKFMQILSIATILAVTARLLGII